MEYQHGKIYTIRSHQTNRYYIGSTNHKTLAQRLGKHRGNYKEYLNNTRRYVSSYEILQYTDHYIELLETYPCNTKAELHRREGELIRQYRSDVVNMCIPGNKTIEQIAEYQKQYYEDNKTNLSEYKKQYRLENKEYIAEQIKVLNKKTIICNCGIVITKYYSPSHLRTNIHTTNINNLYLNELNYYIL